MLIDRINVKPFIKLITGELENQIGTDWAESTESERLEPTKLVKLKRLDGLSFADV